MISRAILDAAVLSTLRRKLLQLEFIEPALKAYENEYKQLNKAIERKRPKLERRLRKISCARRSSLRLLEEGLEPKEIRDYMLELDQEERGIRDELQHLPKRIGFEPEAVIEEYRAAVGSLLQKSLDGNYAYKREVKNVVRTLIEKVVVYPTDDSQGRDIELVGDIEKVCVPHDIGMEAMVPGGGIEQAF